ncbi:MAG: YeeE/YedE family protein, partial [Paracoccaceae bacterium]
VVLGLAARLGRFCTLGAVEDMLYQGSSVRMRMWGLAIGVAVLGSFTLIGLGLLQPEQSIYLGFAFNPFAAVLGGLVFGYGMALAGNCGFGTLARLGGGDLRSFVIVLVMGISAYVTLSGPLAALRVAVFPAPPVEGALPGLAHLIAESAGLPLVATGLAIGGAIVVIALWSSQMRARPKAIFWGAMVGLAVASGWAGTQWVAAHGFAAVPVESHTFSAPLGDTILYLMTSSGTSLNFGVGSVAGVLLGAFIGSLINGHFRWEACEDPRELRRQILGGALMGVGAVVAFGCTIGQGISAFSVLAFSAPVTMLSIIAGCAFGLRQLIEGFAPAE